jgi:hypothetical protein
MRGNSHFLAIALFFTFCVGLASAQQTVQQASPATTPAPSDEEKLLRDPFWPPDYTPKNETVTPPPVQETNINTNSTPLPPLQVVEKWPVLKLKGLIKSPNGKYVAQIEGIGIVESGRVVRVKKDGMVFSWTIGDITEKGVEITPLDARPGR